MVEDARLVPRLKAGLDSTLAQFEGVQAQNLDAKLAALKHR
jgi:hypothetical protein